MPPEPTVEGAVSTDTKLEWDLVPGAAKYVVRWRRTNGDQWTESVRVPVRNPPYHDGESTTLGYGEILEGIRVDDWVFGVSSVSADGYESPVASAVPGGAFKPWTPPAAE